MYEKIRPEREDRAPRDKGRLVDKCAMNNKFSKWQDFGRLAWSVGADGVCGAVKTRNMRGVGELFSRDQGTIGWEEAER